MSLADLMLLWAACALGLGVCVVALRLLWSEARLRRDRDWHHACHVKLTREAADALIRAKRAEAACEELRSSLMRGSALVEVDRDNSHPRADRRIQIAVIADRPAAFTNSGLPAAWSLYEHLVATKQIKPIR